MKLPRGQFLTWLEHAMIAVAIPGTAGAVVRIFGGDGLRMAAITSTVTIAVFLARELRDAIRHRADFDAGGNADGVTWRADMWGDLNGPLTATLTYWVVWLFLV